VVIRGSYSIPLTKGSISNTPPLKRLSSSQGKQKKQYKGKVVKTDRQVNISYKGSVLKGSFQGDTSENLQVAHDGGVLKAYATNDLVFTP